MSILSEIQSCEFSVCGKTEIYNSCVTCEKKARDDGILLFVLEAYSFVDTLDVEQTPTQHK
jgi:hypothetical protein